MSYHRASEATPASGAASVTVCTNDLALCNLVEDALPVSALKALGDAELLVPEVVELKHDRIGLAAVDAWVLSQIGDQILKALSDERFLSSSRLLDVSLTVGAVMLLLVGGAAGSAVVVALPARLRRQAKSTNGFSSWQRPHLRIGRAYESEQTFVSVFCLRS